MKRWIWQYENYPHFTYQFETLEHLLQKIAMEQGYLLALSQTLSQDTILQRQCDALLNETLSTAAIEGEKYRNRRKRLGLRFNLICALVNFDRGFRVV